MKEMLNNFEKMISVIDLIRWLLWIIVIIACFSSISWDYWVVILLICLAIVSETQCIINNEKTKKFNLLLEAIERTINERIKISYTINTKEK